MFPEQIIYHLDEIDGKTAPLKLNGDVIHNGINAKFTPLILNIEDDTASVLVFTDGSQKKSNIVPPEVAAGAAWLVRLPDGRVQQGRVVCVKATPYDAEMVALARGLKEATERVQENSLTSTYLQATRQHSPQSWLQHQAHHRWYQWLPAKQ